MHSTKSGGLTAPARLWKPGSLSRSVGLMLKVDLVKGFGDTLMHLSRVQQMRIKMGSVHV